MSSKAPSSNRSSAVVAGSYKVRPVGALHTLDYRIFLENEQGDRVSPFHDVPLWANEAEGILNMIVEIPRWSNAKLEISTGSKYNPIKQDEKDAKPRFVKNVFPYKGYIWNYGAFPQTWENPNHIDADTKAGGDKDPLDVCEIGERIAHSGEVKQVKVLGVFGLLDQGETDWKVLAIDVRDPLAKSLNDLADIERECPGLLAATHEWFEVYKIPDGKKKNNFAFEGQPKDKKFAMKVIKETNEAWKELIHKKSPNKTENYNIDCTNVSVDGSPYKETAQKTPSEQKDAAKPAQPVDPAGKKVDHK